MPLPLEQTFDQAMYLAENSGNKLYVVMQHAAWLDPPQVRHSAVALPPVLQGVFSCDCC